MLWRKPGQEGGQGGPHGEEHPGDLKEAREEAIWSPPVLSLEEEEEDGEETRGGGGGGGVRKRERLSEGGLKVGYFRDAGVGQERPGAARGSLLCGAGAAG